MHATIIVLAFAGLSVAQSTTSLFIPGADAQPFIASIIGSDTLATTYAVECAPGTDASDCGFPGGFILTEGPSTAAYTLSMGYQNGSTSILAFTGYIDCSLAGSPATAGVCTESFGGDEANDPGMSTTTLGSTDITYFPVTISDFTLDGTAVVSASATGSTGAGSSATPAANTRSAATASNTSTGKTTISTGTASGTVSAQTTGASSSSKAVAAHAMVTGKAQWIVGGAAVAMAIF